MHDAVHQCNVHRVSGPTRHKPANQGMSKQRYVAEQIQQFVPARLVREPQPLLRSGRHAHVQSTRHWPESCSPDQAHSRARHPGRRSKPNVRAGAIRVRGRSPVSPRICQSLRPYQWMRDRASLADHLESLRLGSIGDTLVAIDGRRHALRMQHVAPPPDAGVSRRPAWPRSSAKGLRTPVQRSATRDCRSRPARCRCPRESQDAQQVFGGRQQDPLAHQAGCIAHLGNMLASWPGSRNPSRSVRTNTTPLPAAERVSASCVTWHAAVQAHAAGRYRTFLIVRSKREAGRCSVGNWH